VKAPSNQDLEDRQARTSVAAARARFSGKLLVTAGTFLAALVLAVIGLAWRLNTVAGRSRLQPQLNNFTETFRRYPGHPGPWGNLEYLRITIARPDPFVYIAGMDSRESRWHFSRQTLDAVKSDLNSVGFTVDQVDWLTDPARCLQRTNGWQITPGPDFIFGMKPKVRAVFYAMLAKDAANPYQNQPLSWRKDGVEEWMEGAGLMDETEALVKRLLYERGNTWCFSDMPAILSHIPLEAEKKQLIKALSRNNTLLMKLRVPYGADVSELARYWSLGGRTKDVYPLLESLAQVPGGASIDIAHLLPSMARRHLYTYEYPPGVGTVSKANCFWTAMNFFNLVPDDRFTSLTETLDCLRVQYVLVDDAPLLGDVLMFERPGEGFINAAVYIADNVVFTKNGSDHKQPWLLMRLEDVVARYPCSPPIRINRFRSNDINWSGPRRAT
jgi:hypothetical protein